MPPSRGAQRGRVLVEIYKSCMQGVWGSSDCTLARRPSRRAARHPLNRFSRWALVARQHYRHRGTATSTADVAVVVVESYGRELAVFVPAIFVPAVAARGADDAEQGAAERREAGNRGEELRLDEAGSSEDLSSRLGALHHPSAAIRGIRMPFDVPFTLETFDGARHRLRLDPREGREVDLRRGTALEKVQHDQAGVAEAERGEGVQPCVLDQAGCRG
jgi:hypothetical protein